MTRSVLDPAELVEAAAGGDQRALARLLSLVERGGPSARAVGRLTFGRGSGGYTVAVTGPPGGGKSTLTDGLIGEVRKARTSPVAVLAVDPTSPFSGGAILGDRVRMQRHALDGGVFIRSMASRGHLGGLAAAAPEAVRVLTATGWPLVLVETVGVGQVEVEVAGTCDTTVVVLNPGWGDSVQVAKAGLLEVADVFVVNKADRPGALEAKQDLAAMLRLADKPCWSPPIVLAVATSGEGIADTLEAVEAHRRHLTETGELAARRSARVDNELRTLLLASAAGAIDRLAAGPGYAEVRAALDEGAIDLYQAADRLLAALVLAPGDGT